MHIFFSRHPHTHAYTHTNLNNMCEPSDWILKLDEIRDLLQGQVCTAVFVAKVHKKYLNIA